MDLCISFVYILHLFSDFHMFCFALYLVCLVVACGFQ